MASSSRSGPRTAEHMGRPGARQMPGPGGRPLPGTEHVSRPLGERRPFGGRDLVASSLGCHRLRAGRRTRRPTEELHLRPPPPGARLGFVKRPTQRRMRSAASPASGTLSRWRRAIDVRIRKRHSTSLRDTTARGQSNGRGTRPGGRRGGGQAIAGGADSADNLLVIVAVRIGERVAGTVQPPLDLRARSLELMADLGREASSAVDASTCASRSPSRRQRGVRALARTCTPARGASSAAATGRARTRSVAAGR